MTTVPAKYQSSFKGLLVYPNGTSLNVRVGSTTTVAILVNIPSGALAGKATGLFVDRPDGRWFEIELVKPVGKVTKGWARQDVIKLVKVVTQAQAQSLVDNLVKSDDEIYHGILRMTPLVKAAQSNNRISNDQMKVYAGLITRLSSRQSKIKRSEVLKIQTGIKKGYEDLKNYFASVIKGSAFEKPVSDAAIGIVPIAGLVIAAIVGAGLAVTAYYMFKPDYDDSAKDLIVSKDLEKALSTLAPDKRKEVVDNLNKQIDQAYNSGKTDGSFSGMFSIIKPLAIALGGYYLITKFVLKNK